MEGLGIPLDWIGEDESGLWRAYLPEEWSGGYNSRGMTVNSGCLNPKLLGDSVIGQRWRDARLRDRIDAIIAHEFKEMLGGSHEIALQKAPLTSLQISGLARGLLRSMME